MKIKPKSIVLGCLSAMALSMFTSAAMAEGLQKRIIVKYKESSAASSQALQSLSQPLSTAAAQMAQSGKLEYKRAMTLPNHHVYSVNAASEKEYQYRVQQLASDPNVEFVEEDRILRPFFSPNDPRYSDQWHYFDNTSGIGLPSAWNTVKGDGVTVAVLDTGYRPHADLAANLLPGYDMISDEFIGNDGDGRDSDPIDPGDAVKAGECGDNYPPRDQGSSWHGTHVAGTVAAVGDNGVGVTGVAPNAKIVPVRVLGKCGGYTSDIADGILWASGANVSGAPSNNNPAQVINMSLGGSGSCSPTTQSAIDTARQNGTTIVVAAGNSDDNADNYNPGNCNGVINVAATDINAGRSYYSNYGSVVDVSAPGGAMSVANDPNGVLSTYNSGSTVPGSDSYGYSQGTSMAAPHVAGAAALIYSLDPSLTPDEVKNVLVANVKPVSDNCTGCGSGIIDVAAAVQALDDDTPEPTPNVLENGVAVTGLSGSQGSETVFSIDVPAGAQDLSFVLNGPSGDADLYVKFGSEPTLNSYDCRPYIGGSNETCNINNVQAGTYYVMIRGYSAYSNASILASFTEEQAVDAIEEYNVSASTGQWVHFTIDVAAGTSELVANISGGSGDADLYVRPGSQPTDSQYSCRPYRNGNSETCTLSQPQAGTWYVSVKAYRSFSGLTVTATQQ